MRSFFFIPPVNGFFGLQIGKGVLTFPFETLDDLRVFLDTMRSAVCVFKSTKAVDDDKDGVKVNNGLGKRLFFEDEPFGDVFLQ